MATKQQLQELLERVEEAEGPDRELDFELALLHKVAPPDSWYDKVNDCIEWRELVDYGSTQVPMPVGSDLFNYTASLDAVIALVEEKLPGGRWTISQGDRYAATIYNESRTEVLSGLCAAPSPALALITATLKALVKLKEN